MREEDLSSSCHNIKIGDVVMLKSGGIKMTVASILRDAGIDKVVCAYSTFGNGSSWSADSGPRIESRSFEPICLVRVR